MWSKGLKNSSRRGGESDCGVCNWVRAGGSTRWVKEGCVVSEGSNFCEALSVTVSCGAVLLPCRGGGHSFMGRKSASQ
jgi:hypothetical protein